MWVATVSVVELDAYGRSVATFVIEAYLSRARASDLDQASAQLRLAAESSRSADPSIRHLRSFYVAEDELAYHLVEAASIEAVVELSRSAHLVADRIVEVAASG